MLGRDPLLLLEETSLSLLVLLEEKSTKRPSWSKAKASDQASLLVSIGLSSEIVSENSVNASDERPLLSKTFWLLLFLVFKKNFESRLAPKSFIVLFL